MIEYMLVIGCFLVGFMIPNFIEAYTKGRFPLLASIYTGLGFALIAAYIAFK